MKIRDAYNEWASTYDSVSNKTRDIEAKALIMSLQNIEFKNVLEIGCGTGKNTEWLAGRAEKVTAVDFSDGMLSIAESKTYQKEVKFVKADITHTWTFSAEKFDLVTCSLILEHISDINHIFEQASALLKSGGHFYIGELHSYRQYLGVKAKFGRDDQIQEIESFTHNVSDFFRAGALNEFSCVDISEWFDEDTAEPLPRLISMLNRKK